MNICYIYIFICMYFFQFKFKLRRVVGTSRIREKERIKKNCPFGESAGVEGVCESRECRALLDRQRAGGRARGPQAQAVHRQFISITRSSSSPSHLHGFFIKLYLVSSLVTRHLLHRDSTDRLQTRVHTRLFAIYTYTPAPALA